MLRLNELLSTPSTQLGKASRFVVFQIKMWSHCARLLKKNRSGQHAIDMEYALDAAHFHLVPKGGFVRERLVDEKVILE